MAVAEIALPATSFADRVSQFLERVEYREPATTAEREEIYRLRFDAYLREGYVVPGAPKRLTDDLDHLPNAWTIGVYVDAALAGTLRLHVLTGEHRGSFGHRLFPDLLDPDLDNGRIIIEPSKFAVAREGAQRHPELPYAIARLGLMCAAYFGAERIIATVRREHIAFYKRVYLFRELCPPRPSELFPMPVHLVGHDYPSVIGAILARFPFNQATGEEKRALFARSLGPTRTNERLTTIEA